MAIHLPLQPLAIIVNEKWFDVASPLNFVFLWEIFDFSSATFFLKQTWSEPLPLPHVEIYWVLQLIIPCWNKILIDLEIQSSLRPWWKFEIFIIQNLATIMTMLSSML